ncbi:hypothetical protein, partial [Lichenifustis flavocetrariae]
MGSADPVERQDDLGRSVIEIGKGFMDQGAHDPLLEPRIGGGRRPHGLEIVGERRQGDRRPFGSWGHRDVMIGDPRLELSHTRQGPVPAGFQFTCHEAVLGIGRIVLPEGPIGVVSGRLEIARHGLARFIAPCRDLRLGCPCGFYRGRLHDSQQRCFHQIVDPQAAERDA